MNGQSAGHMHVLIIWYKLLAKIIFTCFKRSIHAIFVKNFRLLRFIRSNDFLMITAQTSRYIIIELRESRSILDAIIIGIENLLTMSYN